MATPSLQNIYHLRTVATPSAKSCMVCFKPSTAVLITPDSKDFFYICRGHLKDRAFAVPVVDEAEAAAKKRQAELEKEIESVKAEFALKEKAKKEKAKEKGKGKDEGGKDGKDGKDVEEEKEKEKEKEKGKGDEKGKDAAATAATSSVAAGTETTGETTTEELPRIYALHRNFFQMRLDRIRQAELAKRNRERLSNPSTFPSVPSGIP